MLIMSTLARQQGKPLMLFNTTWTTANGKQKATLVALVLGVIDELRHWHPTTESEDTMNRMNDILPAGWPFTVSVAEGDKPPRRALEDALFRTPKNCGLIICTGAIDDYKGIYQELNIQGGRPI